VKQLSPGKWLCVGGGGYRDSVVPRVWALAWGEMTGMELSDELPPRYREMYPEEACLRDSRMPELDLELRALASVHAEECVAFLKSELRLDA
jgi:acetoin utilization deacetylase AcuC-like enzyme